MRWRTNGLLYWGTNAVQSLFIRRYGVIHINMCPRGMKTRPGVDWFSERELGVTIMIGGEPGRW